ncbi:hypothetical protein SCATT_p16730 (plasmid) [Streptantibioticus cattleyicolor NRRL 8057 = DSM 46488]|uniref:Uncharacterized protein n=1 Tax=Streptantibioticus cattleyicolor (strain ATCC 35852 / DSM 46488 / JCM 4925 / NBRC 14057 / NRRL 8057) TaxID=1003195 RepID=G8XHM9_STREN|nr:hypothetical protein SCATT_p16730 [Streptantibioticus cattleyicolor NRRL 8057 = DSM 46488]
MRHPVPDRFMECPSLRRTRRRPTAAGDPPALPNDPETGPPPHQDHCRRAHHLRTVVRAVRRDGSVASPSRLP